VSPRVRRHLRELIAIGVFVAIAAVVSAYILDHQRLRWPWEDVMRIEATFSSAQAVTAGQGQAVVVAGVQVGEISAVRLEDGRAVVEMELEPEKVGPVYRNATMLLRPKTGLNDMAVQLDPGTQESGELHDGDRLAGANTLPNVNPDEVLASLDADARRYLAIVANAGGQGLRGNGVRLREVLKASQPTLERTARVTRVLADRRERLRRLVSNLRRLSRATASKDRRLAELVQAASQALGAIGRREAELAEAIDRLPGTLAAGREALAGARSLSLEAGPAARQLLPVARELEPALRELRPLLRDATPILRDDLRPLVRQTTPLLADLRPALADLVRAAPDLVRTGELLNYVANELGYNPPGAEEGYLFWASWFFHNAATILSLEDAHGGVWRGLVMVGCSSLGEAIGANPALAPLGEVPVCPAQPQGARR
jgi:phospholipid/cholesterol/gamma-HCH transport system substrate-binding protein